MKLRLKKTNEKSYQFPIYQVVGFEGVTVNRTAEAFTQMIEVNINGKIQMLECSLKAFKESGREWLKEQGL